MLATRDSATGHGYTNELPRCGMAAAGPLVFVFGLLAVVQLRHELGARGSVTRFEQRQRFAERPLPGRTAGEACFKAARHELAQRSRW